MSNHLSDLLAQWYPNRDEFDWVLATIYDAKGPCYRKPGAMMLFSSRGDQLGMLSGGCLESDIATNARKVMHTKQSLLVCYDGSDEDDMSFHLGIGCGGTLYIMLQQISETNHYLALLDVHQALINRVSGCYTQSVVGEHLEEQAYFEAKLRLITSNYRMLATYLFATRAIIPLIYSSCVGSLLTGSFLISRNFVNIVFSWSLGTLLTKP